MWALFPLFSFVRKHTHSHTHTHTHMHKHSLSLLLSLLHSLSLTHTHSASKTCCTLVCHRRHIYLSSSCQVFVESDWDHFFCFHSNLLFKDFRIPNFVSSVLNWMSLREVVPVSFMKWSEIIPGLQNIIHEKGYELFHNHSDYLRTMIHSNKIEAMHLNNINKKCM